MLRCNVEIKVVRMVSSCKYSGIIIILSNLLPPLLCLIDNDLFACCEVLMIFCIAHCCAVFHKNKNTMIKCGKVIET